MDGSAALREALTHPESILQRTGEELGQLLAAAREAGMLGTLWHLAQIHDIDETIPEALARHLRGGFIRSEHNTEALRWELETLQNTLLNKLPAPIALKGSAYLLRQLPNAPGRISQDIDLMYPSSQVEAAEELLQFEGWTTTHHDDYDQRYYREWMHELPPLQHKVRGTTIDLHHNILPRTFKVRINPQRLWEHSLPAPLPWRYRLLCDEHMVLHCVCHLFSETDWARSIRDLYDIKVLIEHFQQTEGDGFIDRLIHEAEALGLSWILERALTLAASALHLALPERAWQPLKPHQPSAITRPLERSIYLHGINTHATDSPARDTFAQAALFVRGHYLKMPLPLLVKHLTHKALTKTPD
ncbi:nucleotidyltransferase domain-containing protein [Ectothiorhodospira marina]|uniref:Uncharacterized nucleotidyltransferase n=1 Tax=Ectothiorhodospira marina TaxID=1396821 RepID=A0A1H7I8I0_9GAMM|nr:nucleotidyltransferase family protein [Ectothiorhodospira marina]SEK58861.1 Uncharacterised nucleotidyltransferase [Ectothiorhodospira marina]